MTRQGGVQEAANVVRARLAGIEPRAAVILGSGLGGLAQAVEAPRRIAYRDIPGFPNAAVTGHAGELVAGLLDDVPVLLENGRFHLYEGHDPATVALPVRVFAALGIRTLIVTNAAGGLRLTFQPPTLMLIADHLNLMWRNPLIGPVVGDEPRFPDMSDPYDRQLRELARRHARELGVRLEEGVYAGLLGPSYETPAEIRMLQRLGADAVGMSTVPEVIAAVAAGMRVLGISSITNFGAGLTNARLSHDEVLQAGQQTARDLERLVRSILPEVAPRS